MSISTYTKQKLKNLLKDYMDDNLKKDSNNPFMYFSPFRNERTASLSLDRKDPTYCTDFGTGKSYDVFSLYAEMNGQDNEKDFLQIAESIAKRYNVIIDYDTKQQPQQIKEQIQKQEPKQQDFKEYYKSLGNINNYPEATNYLKSRCISEESIKKYNILFDNYKKQIVIPCNDSFYTGRNIDEEKIKQYGKHFKPSGAKTTLFNGQNLQNSTTTTALYITESITDAISIEEANPELKTIALNSTQNKNLLIDEIKKAEYKGYIVLLLDADESGIKASQEIQSELNKINIYSYIVNNKYNCYNGEWKPSKNDANILELTIKDFNEFLKYLADRENKGFATSYLQTIQADAQAEYKKYLLHDLTPTSEYIRTLENEIKDSDTYKPIKTNIEKLDEALNGGLFAKNLITLIADTSIGKTAFTLQIADNIAKERPVLYFSLEMSQSELIARSISRFMSLYTDGETSRNYNLTQLEILQGKQYNSIEYLKAYNEAKAEYKKQVNDNLFIYECLEEKENTITEIQNKINRFIAKTNNKPVVFIDYLQYIDADEKNATDKQATDKIIRVLKGIARKQEIPIFAISSTARGNYNQETNIASGKNSGDIEFTSDILLGLNLEAVADVKLNTNGKPKAEDKKKIKLASKQATRDIYLTIMKNRNGRRDIDIKNIKFTPSINYYDFTQANIE